MAKKGKQKTDKKAKPKYITEYKGQSLGMDGVMRAMACGRDLLVVAASEFKGQKYLNIRKLWNNNEQEWSPGKGVSIPADLAPAFLSMFDDDQFKKQLLHNLGA